MNNILNIIKLDIKNKKVQLIIEAAVILFFTIQFSVFGRWIPSEVTFIPIICVILLVNLISSIVKFMKCISTEEGRLLFMAPIKGWEFLCAKYMEFFIEGLLLIIITAIGTLISGGKITLLMMSSLSIIKGFLIFFILVTTLEIVFKSYFSNNGVCIILTTVSMALFGGMLSILQLIHYIALPSIYIIIGETIELNLFNVFVEIIAFGILIYMAVYHVDKKLDIV